MVMSQTSIVEYRIFFMLIYFEACTSFHFDSRSAHLGSAWYITFGIPHTIQDVD
jgi:hypothetical protein